MGPGTLPLIVAVITCGPCWLVWAVHYLCGGASCTILIKAVMANMAFWLVFLHAPETKPSISFTCLEDSELQPLYSSVESSYGHLWNINTVDKISVDTKIAMQPRVFHHKRSASHSNRYPWTDWERLSRRISNYTDVLESLLITDWGNQEPHWTPGALLN